MPDGAECATVPDAAFQALVFGLEVAVLDAGRGESGSLERDPEELAALRRLSRAALAGGCGRAVASARTRGARRRGTRSCRSNGLPSRDLRPSPYVRNAPFCTPLTSPASGEPGDCADVRAHDWDLATETLGAPADTDLTSRDHHPRLARVSRRGPCRAVPAAPTRTSQCHRGAYL